MRGVEGEHSSFKLGPGGAPRVGVVGAGHDPELSGIAVGCREADGILRKGLVVFATMDEKDRLPGAADGINGRRLGQIRAVAQIGPQQTGVDDEGRGPVQPGGGQTSHALFADC